MQMRFTSKLRLVEIPSAVTTSTVSYISLVFAVAIRKESAPIFEKLRIVSIIALI